jgi:hypothetical protein
LPLLDIPGVFFGFACNRLECRKHSLRRVRFVVVVVVVVVVFVVAAASQLLLHVRLFRLVCLLYCSRLTSSWMQKNDDLTLPSLCRETSNKRQTNRSRMLWCKGMANDVAIVVVVVTRFFWDMMMSDANNNAHDDDDHDEDDDTVQPLR